MQEMYEIHLPALMNSAIEDLERPLPDAPGLRTLQGDLIYGGDLSKWRKAAYAVRARYNLHIAVKNPAALSAAVADAERAFSSNADDFQLVYEENVQNPWFIFLGNAVNKVQRPGSYITNLMNGTAYYADVVDPRITRYMDNRGADNFRGVGPGFLIDDEQGVNVDLTQTTWHSRNVAPLQMMTYPEMQFILAEALLSTNPTAAYEAYLNGITASMEKVGVSTAEILAYTQDPQVAVGAANLTLADVMLQKYIALYLNIETWTDMRRYQYDPSVYVGLEKPSGVRNQLPGQGWIQRSNIPDDEPGTNTCLPEIPNQGVKLWLFDN
ncbi:SusD/RagB family nutrient-binding outer membrane lipoprotein [Nitritalea halalkaliphila]|uniref:SusD/RagB family nutrient-binding outer membrane lipoprotein n=1 Tax=Nitritalea halalkaliphila TaxID=590849 RepID=UPI000A040331|nr:SusD/RagB family nutrient-binding outer membrane lipoprotein [Nitritalea halalkaliphila]